MALDRGPNGLMEVDGGRAIVSTIVVVEKILREGRPCLPPVEQPLQ